MWQGAGSFYFDLRLFGLYAMVSCDSFGEIMTWIGTLALALRISVIIRLTLLGLSFFITNMEIIIIT